MSEQRFDPERFVALAGDWHGAGDWAGQVLRALGSVGVDTVYHVGDFGVWPGQGGLDYLGAVEAAAAASGITVWVTPGNHEDWDRLDALFAEHGTERPAPISERIALLPPGFRWRRGGRGFLSLGGAPTLSFERRTAGVDWWPQEELSEESVARAVAGGHAEVMISHDGPDGGTVEVADTIATNPFGFSARAQARADTGRERITRAFHAVRPRLIAHGHYHVYGEVEKTFPDDAPAAVGPAAAAARAARDAAPAVADDARAVWRSRIVSLDRERRPGNIRLLDLDGFTVHELPGLPVS